MAWAKLDDGFGDHPRIAPLSDKAFRAYVLGLCYANRYLTDGDLPALAVAKLATAKTRNELVAVGLWRENGDESVKIRDFLQWNRDAESVKKERRANAERQERHRKRKARNAVTNALRNDVSNAVPSHPIPSDPLTTEALPEEGPCTCAKPLPSETDASHCSRCGGHIEDGLSEFASEESEAERLKRIEEEYLERTRRDFERSQKVEEEW